MSNIPIVQGVAVDPEPPKNYYQHDSAPPQQYYSDGDYPSTQELRQLRQHPKTEFQDVFWSIAFICHLIVMIALCALGISSGGGVDNSGAYGNIIFVVSITGLCAIGISSLSLSLMMKYTETLVQTALIFSVISSLAVGVIGLMLGSIMMAVLGFLSFAFGICYARIVWPRIPFAAANLNTALTAVRQNMGLTAVAFGFTGLAFGWTILWFLGMGDALAGDKAPIIFLLFLSYYWVHQVLQNTMHVTTAGVIGTWWFVPDEASSWWSSALTSSLVRATTYSFGSICFGSFLVALVQALRALERYSRNNDDLNFLSCIIQCILGCIESIIEELNQWAYVYVGLYGFSYLEASRNVMQLFEAKGWTVIISDDLANNVLFMISVAVGLATGLVGLVMGSLESGMFENLGIDNAGGPAFVIGFLSGFLFATVIMSVVGSAVNTVIVCYAEDPATFQMNHPQLSAEMRAAWVQAWPGVVM